MIDQFLKAGGVTNVNDFYKKFPTEEHFNHYMKYGGINAYAGGGPILPGTMSAALQGLQNEPVVGDDGMSQYIRRPEEIVSPAPEQISAAMSSAKSAKSSPYGGVSIVDFLASQGKAIDKGSRKKLATKLGIPNYTGKAEENLHILHIIVNNPEILDDYPTYSSAKETKKSYTKKETNTPQPVISPVVPPVLITPAPIDSSDYNNAQAALNPYVTAPLQQQSSGNGLKTALAVGTGLGTAGLGYAAYKKLPGMIASIKDVNESVIDKKAVREAAMKQKALLMERLSNIRKIREENAAIKAAKAAKNAIGLGTRLKNALGVLSKTKYLEPLVEGTKAAFEALPIKEYGGEQYTYGGAYANVPQHGNPGMYSDGYSGTSSGGQYFDDGGSFIPQYGDSAYGQLPQYGYGKAMYGTGMAYGGMYQDGGMPPDQQAMMAEQQGQQEQQMPPQQDQPDPQQLMQEIAQMLQQGAQPEQIMQQLVQMGIPEEQAQQMIQQVMQQMQGGQEAPQQEMMEDQGPPMGRFGRQLKMGGSSNYHVGKEYDMSDNDIQDLIKKGYKIQYI